MFPRRNPPRFTRGVPTASPKHTATFNGGSLRAYIRNRNADPNRFADATYRELAEERLQALREQEVKLGLDDIAVYREFAVWVNRIREDVVGFIKEQVARGKKVFVYVLEEFRLREKTYLLSGGKFIVPMPHFTLI